MKTIATNALLVGMASSVALDAADGWWDGSGVSTNGCAPCLVGDGAMTYNCFEPAVCGSFPGKYEDPYTDCNTGSLKFCSPCFPLAGAPCADPASNPTIASCADCYGKADACFQKDVCPFLSKGKFAYPNGTTDAGLDGCNAGIECAGCYGMVAARDRDYSCGQCDPSIVNYHLTSAKDEAVAAACADIIKTPGDMEKVCTCLSGMSKTVAGKGINCMMDVATSYASLAVQREKCMAEAVEEVLHTGTVVFADPLADDAAVAAAADAACNSYLSTVWGYGATLRKDSVTCTLAAASGRRLLETTYTLTVTLTDSMGVDAVTNLDLVREEQLVHIIGKYGWHTCQCREATMCRIMTERL
jgi:hypothetical protein